MICGRFFFYSLLHNTFKHYFPRAHTQLKELSSTSSPLAEDEDDDTSVFPFYLSLSHRGHTKISGRKYTILLLLYFYFPISPHTRRRRRVLVERDRAKCSLWSHTHTIIGKCTRARPHTHYCTGGSAVNDGDDDDDG